MVRKAIQVVLICQILAFNSQLVLADEDYSECRIRCEEETADCMSEPRDYDRAVQVAREAACARQGESCNAGCESLKSKDEELGEQYNHRNPNIIYNPGLIYKPNTIKK